MKGSVEISTISIFSLDVGGLLGSSVPPELASAADSSLQKQVSGKRLRGALAQVFGTDLHLHLTTFSGDLSEGENPLTVAAHAALEAGGATLQEAKAKGLTTPALEKALKGDPQTRSQSLSLRQVDLPFQERGAEPIIVAKALGGSWGFFNRAVFNLFFNPDKGSGRRIEGNDFLGVVESIEDLKEGRTEVRTFEFGPGNINEMVALVADADEWRLSRVYAVRGKFGQGPQSDLPALVVGGGEHPVLIGRSQSGLPAVGEFNQAVGEFYFGPGGPGGDYRVGLMPADFDTARPLTSPPCTARVVAYAYQSFGQGRIPAETDVVDMFAQNRAETIRLQREAGGLIAHMAFHGRFEPHLNPAAAESRAQQIMDILEGRFQEIPDADPLLEAANGRAAFTISDIKADSGGKVGHTSPPHHFSPVAEASLREAKDAGLIFGTSEIIEVGDDGHLLMSHDRGVDNNEIHLFAYRTFFRQVWVAEVLGYKWYGLGQDLVGEATEGRTTEELANLTDRFVELLDGSLPPAEAGRLKELQASYRKWQDGSDGGRKPLAVFSGNVSGQGPGFAEIPLTGPGRIGLLAMDKTGPSAFNLPIWWSLNRARSDETLTAYLQARGATGAVYEIWDVEHHRRVFLDLETESAAIGSLLGAIERFNVKRIWSRTGGEWDPSRLDSDLQEVLLAASTEKLAVITGGEYRGKDDPVLLAVEPIAEALNLFMRDNYYLTQGDGRGSHFMFPTPLSFQDAIATVNSRAVSVSAWITIDPSGEIQSFRDVFADPSYEASRDRAFAVNKAIWDAQGGNFIPVGVGSAKVEQSYPLAKTLARVTAADSPFVSKRPVSRNAPGELVGT